jgi:outer membrane protein assembly factor BamD
VAAGARVRTRLAAASLLAALLGACASSNVDLEKLSSPSDEVVWEAGKAAVEKKDWTGARQYLRRLIDAFPQSEHQAEARIALADSYMSQGGAGNYVLAIAAYREFLTLYPSHPLSPYAQFQTAEAYFKQMNSPDRDQTATRQALEEFQRLLDIYPDSDRVEEARERIHDCRQTLARSEYDIGYFYQRTRKAYRASIFRYKDILRNYPDYEKMDEVLYRLGESLAAAALYAEARPQLGRLLEEYPESQYANDARKLLGEMPEVLPVPADAGAAAASEGPAPPATTAAPAPSQDPSPADGAAVQSPPQV